MANPDKNQCPSGKELTSLYLYCHTLAWLPRPVFKLFNQKVLIGCKFDHHSYPIRDKLLERFKGAKDNKEN
jgi:hypothetical protein